MAPLHYPAGAFLTGTLGHFHTEAFALTVVMGVDNAC